MRAYSMERFAIPPLVGVWAPIRGRDCEGTALPYCESHLCSTFNLGVYLGVDANNHL